MEVKRESILRVVVESERDSRTLAYLFATCGEQAVEQACGQLPGSRRPYVSNLARVLRVSIPDSVVKTPRAEGIEQLAAIKQLLERAAKLLP